MRALPAIAVAAAGRTGESTPESTWGRILCGFTQRMPQPVNIAVNCSLRSNHNVFALARDVGVFALARDVGQASV
jgi:hypothetical protein